MFYDTVKTEPNQLKIFQERSEKQEQIIYNLFTAHGKLSPWQAFRLCQQLGRQYPITSVRRSITNLEKEGKLVKTDQQVMGPYRVKEFIWKAI